ncbi:MAG: hypothetical protein QOE58_2019, partial [Actinomycetota bacterium]|nr:hypothetical protein [Actinomycetota bacterium]
MAGALLVYVPGLDSKPKHWKPLLDRMGA